MVDLHPLRGGRAGAEILHLAPITLRGLDSRNPTTTAGEPLLKEGLLWGSHDQQLNDRFRRRADMKPQAIHHRSPPDAAVAATPRPTSPACHLSNPVRDPAPNPARTQPRIPPRPPHTNLVSRPPKVLGILSVSPAPNPSPVQAFAPDLARRFGLIVAGLAALVAHRFLRQPRLSGRSSSRSGPASPEPPAASTA